MNNYKPKHSFANPIVLMLTLFSMLITTPCWAQSETGRTFADSSPSERAQLQTEVMRESLQLSDQQTAEIENINLYYAKEIGTLQNSGKPRLKKFRAVKSLLAEKDKKIEQILTQNQFNDYKNAQEEMRKNIKKKLAERKQHTS